MSEIDQQFIEYVVKSLVGKPDAVSVQRTIDEKGVLLELTVDPEDLGRVIGKRGATAQSLRTLLRALGTKNDARYNLKIVDNGERRPERATDSKTEPSENPTQENDSDSASANGANTQDSLDTTSEQSEEDSTSDRLKQTRQELADLDDLDL